MTFWTDDRIEELKRLAPHHTGSEIARIMGAPTRNVIIGKLSRLKLALNPDRVRVQARPKTERKTAVVIKLPPPMPRQSPTEPVREISGYHPVSTIGGRYHCSLSHLSEDTCRFPLWDDRTPRDERRYCGSMTIEGLSYCDTHCRLLLHRCAEGGMSDCPHCNRPMPETRLGVHLTPLKARIFDLVKRRGSAGIATDELEEATGKTRVTLKSHIWQINDLIEDSGYRIKAHTKANQHMGYGAFYSVVKRSST